MFEDKKLCGILLQNINNHFLIGIGINVLNKPELSNNSIYKPCCILDIINKNSLNETNSRLAYNIFANMVNLTRLSFNSLIKIYCANAYNFNKQITINVGNKAYNGIFKSITQDGKLEIVDADNDSNLISFGDVLM